MIFRIEKDLFTLVIRKPSLLRDGQFLLVEETLELKSNRMGFKPCLWGSNESLLVNVIQSNLIFF